MIKIKNFKQNYIPILFILLLLFYPKLLNAEKIYFDLSDKVINITTNFSGKEIIIFGLSDPDHDTILILKGPKKKARLSIKERLFGIWIETKKYTYSNIPSIFFIASTSAIEDILDESIIRKKGLNFKNFDHNTINNNDLKKTKIYEDSLYMWDNNFIRKQMTNGFYRNYNLEIVDNKLFQARIFFPSNTIPGIYNVEIFQIKDKRITSEDNKKIIIQKTGFGNTIYQFAINQPAFYGIISIIFALIAGVIAATAFRRL
tara:strand:+ start:2109 stop:2885 length:777 start_codon:yes stop_codon:yes gene_type:complete